MNKNILLKVTALVCAVTFLFCSCDRSKGRGLLGMDKEDSIQTEAVAESEEKDSETVQDPKIRALIESYPDMIEEIKDNKVIFRDGTSIEYDDQREKDFKTMLDDSDVEDMFYVPYRLPEGEPEYLEDAGRSRSEALYKKMYGGSESEVRKNLTNVEWFGQNVSFTRINGAADSLKAVAKELSGHPELKPYLKSSGTFYWRPVRGAKRLSAHSYGIAFDIAVDKSDYWQWKAGTNDEMRKIEYANRIPRELVEIFQRHGFIWGGAWYHYDTMHFEFRPEILHYARTR